MFTTISLRKKQSFWIRDSQICTYKIQKPFQCKIWKWTFFLKSKLAIVENWDGESTEYFYQYTLQYLCLIKPWQKSPKGFRSFTFKQPKLTRTSSQFLKGQNLMNKVTNCFFILCVIVFVGSIIFVIILCINPFLFLESGYTPWPEFQNVIQ